MEEIAEEDGYLDPLGAKHWAFFAETGPVLLVTFERAEQIRARDAPWRAPGLGQDVAHGAHRARRPVGNIPGVRAKCAQRFVQNCLGSDFCRQERLPGELPIGKVARGPCHAAHPERRHGVGLELLAEDEFGGPSTNVYDQSAFV